MGTYDDVFAELHRAGVRYVVVGGVAVVLQGHLRMTVDLDLVIDLAPAQAMGAMNVLTSLGFLPRAPVAPADFADPQIRRRWVSEHHMQVLSFYDPADPTREVDIFAEEPVPLEDLLAAATTVVIADTPVAVAARQHLILMKRAAGRAQDLADIEALEQLDAAPND